MTDAPQKSEQCDVAIVGGGTAGLALASELKREGVSRVIILERESEAGGIPRHCGHYPFGLREYKRLLKGPDYAHRNVEAALKLGVDIRTDTTVTKLHAGGALDITTNDGPSRLEASRVVLATGVRESSRAQRFISGDRVSGVLSTAALQSLVYLKGIKPFSRPVILGSELVSFSAINTCRHLGIKPVAMIEETAGLIAQRMLQPYLTLNGIALHTGIKQPYIHGSETVEAISFTAPDGTPNRIECDGVIVSGRFRPEAALLRHSPIEVDPGSGGPIIDQFGRSSDPAYFSAGNLLRPVETSGFCWREGVATAKHILADLSGTLSENQPPIRLIAKDPALKFILPQRLSVCSLSNDQSLGMKHMQIGANQPINGQLVARSGSDLIWSCPIKTRPVRRTLLPLDAIYKLAPTRDIELTIES
ncbi:Thioredoxin reductase [Cohaesibacter sp. ES.047]|uniref:NAD(P)/FAD-dependent oxidoreductase n=1 Tax=Cohaesibacter sp. ES.047 TaxID=1798205 RepID=UPI000BB8F5C9|nr:FAD-dependent oxidoreductase [Cohaesibacter sp. ES.047]SNY91298.1 Thioredoxin reductase [Cohaesibacter sp. ES.047]